MKKYRTAKISPGAHKALKEISTLTGLKMWAALEQAITAKLKDAREQTQTVRQ